MCSGCCGWVLLFLYYCLSWCGFIYLNIYSRCCDCFYLGWFLINPVCGLWDRSGAGWCILIAVTVNYSFIPVCPGFDLQGNDLPSSDLDLDLESSRSLDLG